MIKNRCNFFYTKREGDHQLIWFKYLFVCNDFFLQVMKRDIESLIDCGARVLSSSSLSLSWSSSSWSSSWSSLCSLSCSSLWSSSWSSSCSSSWSSLWSSSWFNLHPHSRHHQGLVFGCLTVNGDLDTPTLKSLISIARWLLVNLYNYVLVYLCHCVIVWMVFQTPQPSKTWPANNPDALCKQKLLQSHQNHCRNWEKQPGLQSHHSHLLQSHQN